MSFLSSCASSLFPLLQDKKSLKLGPDDHLHVEGFALSVFAKADKQDRAGRADLYGLYQLSDMQLLLCTCIILLIWNQ